MEIERFAKFNLGAARVAAVKQRLAEKKACLGIVRGFLQCAFELDDAGGIVTLCKIGLCGRDQCRRIPFTASCERQEDKQHRRGKKEIRRIRLVHLFPWYLAAARSIYLRPNRCIRSYS